MKEPGSASQAGRRSCPRLSSPPLVPSQAAVSEETPPAGRERGARPEVGSSQRCPPLPGYFY